MLIVSRGGPQPSNTLKANFDKRKERGALSGAEFNQLPKTIQDAFNLIKAMGERYLWIDSLCIIQDHDTEKLHIVQLMDVIYTQAFATLVAIEGTDANAGLPGYRAGTRKPQQVELVRSTTSDPSTGKIMVYPITSSPPPLQLALELSKWDTRGWTYQERLLSRRCIYFSNHCVYFQCRSATFCEVEVEQSKVDWGGELDPPSNSLFNIANRSSTSSEPSEDSKWEDFKKYKELVEMYTTRDLTVSSDILSAFSGILGWLGLSTEGLILQGLPTSSFGIALLWNSTMISGHRERSSAGHVNQFPSWSWTGWTSRTSYRLIDRDTNNTLPISQIQDFQITNGKQKFNVQNGEMKELSSNLVDNVANLDLNTGINLASIPLLEFTAHVTSSLNFKIETECTLLSYPDKPYTQTNEAIVSIRNKYNEQCGVLFCTGLGPTAFQDSGDFVAIAKYPNINNRGEIETLGTVEGLVKIFNGHVYQAEDCGLVAVMYVKWRDDGVAERVSVGLIHGLAWERAGARERVVRLC